MTRIYLIFLLLISLTASCKNQNSNEIEVSTEFKLKFLNEILSDTINLKIIETKQVLISNFPLMVSLSPFFLEDIDSASKKMSHSEIISRILNINDTLLVKKQFKSNQEFDLSLLSEYGFNTFDLKTHFYNKTPSLKLNDIIDKENIRLGRNTYEGLFNISKPIFNRTMDKAYVRVQYGGSYGATYVIEKTDGKWSKKTEINSWGE